MKVETKESAIVAIVFCARVCAGSIDVALVAPVRQGLPMGALRSRSGFAVIDNYWSFQEKTLRKHRCCKN